MAIFYGGKKIAVHLHLHYTDLLPYFIKYLNNIPFNYHLYITVTDWKEMEYVKRTCHRCLKSTTHVIFTENRGRDIKPFYSDLRNEMVKFDYVCHIHSKKSLHNKGASEGWLEHLIKTLLGSERVVKSILEEFEGNDRIGLIYPTTYSRIPYWANQWLSNERYAYDLKLKLNVKELPGGYFSFPVGNMFWARVASIKPIFDLALTNDDFCSENGETDGTTHHALERMVSVVANENGYKNLVAAIDQDDRITFSDAEGSINFSGYHENSLDVLRQRIASPHIKVVSFDIFDTLVCRPLFEPDDLFDLMEVKVSGILGKKVDFKKIRTSADAVLRARLEKGYDVTLDQIYMEIASVLNIEADLAIEIKNLEIDFERKILRRRSSLVDMLEFAFGKGKRIVLTSDMYLSKDTVKSLLQNLGITNFHHIYISSQVGYRKDSRTLFPYILEKENVKANEVLHIGDNEHSDIQVAQEIGISTFHIKKPKDLFLETSLAKDVYKPKFKHLAPYARIALMIGINKCFDDPFPKTMSIVNGDLELFGYFYMGPLLLGFTKWVAEIAGKEKINKLLFLSRDGEILYKIYKIIGKYTDKKIPEADYLEISRLSLASLIEDSNDLYKIFNVPYDGDTLENLFKVRLGINISDVEFKILIEFGFESLKSKVYLPKDVEKVKALAEYIFQKHKKIVESKRENTLKYLKDKELFDDSNKAVVDIGYSGTMQRFLNDLNGKAIHGFYMVTYDTIKKNIGNPGVFTKGLFGENIDKFAKKTIPIDKYSLFCEMILSSVNGTVKEYKVESGKPLPVYENVAEEEREKIKKLPLIHKGILNFCDDFLSIFNYIDIIPYEDLNTLQSVFEHFIEHPTFEDIIMFAGYSLDDYYCGNGIFYWVPKLSELKNKNYVREKFLWHQAFSKINTVEASKINDQLQLLDQHHFDTPLDKVIFDKYQNEFEVLPGWYKKIAKFIQLLKGTKKIRIILEDKIQKKVFKTKAEEIQDWYNKEYEIMPTWYKKGGYIIKIISGEKL